VRRAFTYCLLTTAIIAAGLVWAASALPQVIVARPVAKDVTVAVDGQPRELRTTATTVGEALTAAGLPVGAHDVVAPSVDATIAENSQIELRRGRLLHLVIDGAQRDVWVTAPTVDQALAALGYNSSELSGSEPVSPSTRLPLSPTTLALDVARHVTITHDGIVTALTTTAATVEGVLDRLALSVSASDQVTPSPSMPVEDGTLIVIVRITHAEVTQLQPLAFATQQQADPTLDMGRTVVMRAGIAGTESVVYSVTYLDGVMGTELAEASSVITPAIDQIVRVGTSVLAPVDTLMPAARTVSAVVAAARTTAAAQSSAAASKATVPSSPATAAATTTVPTATVPTATVPTTTAPSVAPTTTAAAPPASTSGLNWDAVAQCESSGNWAINTGNGYYGGLQFSASTWISNGGGIYAPTANLATKAQQIAIANKLYAARGAAPWPTCGKYL